MSILSPTGCLLEQRAELSSHLARHLADHTSIDPARLAASPETLDLLCRLVLTCIELGDLPLAKRALTIVNMARDAIRLATPKEWGSWERFFHHHRAERIYLAYTGSLGRAFFTLQQECTARSKNEGDPRFLMDNDRPLVAQAELAWIGLQETELAALADNLWALRQEIDEKGGSSASHFAFHVAATALARAEKSNLVTRGLWRKRATEMALRARRLSEDEEDSLTEIRSLILVSRAELLGGRAAHAAELARHAQDRARDSHAKFLEGRATLMLAIISAARNQPDIALQNASDAAQLAHSEGGSMRYEALFEVAQDLRREQASLRILNASARNQETASANGGDTIILVHGTFVRSQFDGTQWFERNSEFAKKLDECLAKNGSKARCWAHTSDDQEIFFWDARNSFKARQSASNTFAAQLRLLLPQWPVILWHIAMVAM